MERFGATKKMPGIAKPLKEMVGTTGLEPATSTVSTANLLTLNGTDDPFWAQ